MLARTARPDVAILDIRMPKLDGLEAARRIIDDRPIPIVMLTAFTDEATVSRAVDAGVYAYLTKPFREQDVMPAIRTALARHAEHAASRPADSDRRAAATGPLAQRQVARRPRLPLRKRRVGLRGLRRLRLGPGTARTGMVRTGMTVVGGAASRRERGAT